MTEAERLSPIAKLLITGLARPTCAVVGNSPLLLKGRYVRPLPSRARCHHHCQCCHDAAPNTIPATEVQPCCLNTSHRRGAEIDAHDVVFRFNFAPTIGYERSAGSRTTVRVMGRSWVWNESQTPDGAPTAGGMGRHGALAALPCCRSSARRHPDRTHEPSLTSTAVLTVLTANCPRLCAREVHTPKVYLPGRTRRSSCTDTTCWSTCAAPLQQPRVSGRRPQVLHYIA